jgi:aminopeptidase YwaD
MLKDYAEETAENWGLNWIPIVTGVTGDHFWFENAGVPSVSLSQTPDPWYHTAEDTPDKIDITRLEENGELATSVMYDWAKNPELRSKKN